MSTPEHDTRHPVSAMVAHARDELRALADRPIWSMPAAEAGATLVEVTRLAAQVSQLQTRLLAHAERVEVGADVGATSTASWMAHQTRTTRSAHRAARLAKDLDAHPDIDRALSAGELLTDQASVIVEAHLLAEADHHDAKALRVLGRRLLEILNPDAAEAEEARRLAKEEQEARAAASSTMSDDGHGKVHGRFSIPSLHGSMLRKHLFALAAPGRNPDVPVNTPTRHRMGLAFMEYLETRPDSTVPHAGGLAATVVVTMTRETLLGGLEAAGLCDGGRISAGEARRLACQAGIIPVVLGGPSEPLDVGRQRRFHTKAMRIAMGLRDGGCSAEGCDRPPAMTQAHHDRPWSIGGATDLGTGRLLCARHHTLAHDRRYQMKAGPSGKVGFTRRT